MARVNPKTMAEESSGATATAESQDERRLSLVGGDIAAQAPDWLREGDGQSVGDLAGYVIPPRIKVIQGQAKKPFNELFKPGQLCAVPMLRPVWAGEFDQRDPAKNVAFHFIPIMFYPEWVTWNPYGTDLTPVKARSMDSSSEIAVKSRDPERRKEPCRERPTTPDGKAAFISHLEHLNYVIMILKPNEMAGLPIVLTFASGEHKSGTSFNTLVRQRNVRHLYGCQFEARVGRRENKHGTWYGVDVVNPSAESGVTPFLQDRADFDVMEGIYREYKAYRDAKVIQVSLDDEQTVEGSVVAPREDKEM